MTSRTAPAGLGGGLQSYDAIIFDMDGVVTDTASIHAAAWKNLFNQALPELAVTATASFDISEDYRPYVDGRTREDGDRVFLASRGIEVPEGDTDDPTDHWTVRGLAARKQQAPATPAVEGQLPGPVGTNGPAQG
jgi:beta-phosphoglucomutase-like phosphatase (HAD superfamily)